MVVVIDYGMGNLFSLSCALERVGIDHIISSDIDEIKKSDALILPGVGAFRDAIKLLEENNLKQVIIDEVENGKYLLGICLGMQLLFDSSTEFGHFKGLSLIPGIIDKFNISLKVPHMGWNSLNYKEDDITKYLNSNDYVYYVHSYKATCDEKYIIAYSNYETKVPGIVRNKNVLGMQFHPEKSGEVGEKILLAFKEMIL